MRCLPMVSLVLTLALTSPCLARTWYITPDATGDAPTIQAGIDSALAGDTVLLADGTFRGDGNRDIEFSDQPITVLSEGGDPTLCIIDCEGTVTEQHRGFGFPAGIGPETVLEGVTVENGYFGHGGAICCWTSSPTLRNLIIANSHAEGSGGGMICGDGASPTMTDICFLGNVAGSSAGALRLRGGSCPSLWNVLFAYNTCTEFGPAGGGAVFCYQSSPTFTECTFVGNESRFGGAMTIGVGADPTLTNLTFYGNSGQYGSALYIYYEAYPVMERSIVANNGTGGSMYFHNQCGITLSCCNIYANTGGDWTPHIADQYGVRGNFTSCPSFCYAGGDDFHLCDQSPCLPGNHPDGYNCGLIGAWDQGCVCGPTQTEPTTWGCIKAMFR